VGEKNGLTPRGSRDSPTQKQFYQNSPEKERDEKVRTGRGTASGEPPAEEEKKGEEGT